MIEEPNGNNMLNIKLSSNASLPISISNDDLSQSQSASEYTDADESISAPTEYLAEVIVTEMSIAFSSLDFASTWFTETYVHF